MLGYEQTIEIELPLVSGKNSFELKVVDLVGHEATQKFSVSKQGK